MGIAARWIRLVHRERASLRAAYAGFAQAQPWRAAPTVFWAPEDEDRFGFALIVPLRFAPGRPWRWRRWALAPSIATYRKFDERAYLEGDDIWLGGRKIAASEAAAVGGCAVISSGFLPRLAQLRADWTERNVEAAFRGRLEAQNGWQFDHSWPSTLERLAISGALAEEAN